jgi:hypothetical protein
MSVAATKLLHLSEMANFDECKKLQLYLSMAVPVYGSSYGWVSSSIFSQQEITARLAQLHLVANECGPTMQKV